jgi:hypothetical protein
VRFIYFISWEKAQVFNCPPSASLTVGGKCIRTVPKQTDRQKNVNNLYTQTGVNEIQKRFDNLQSNAEKQWGKMDVA